MPLALCVCVRECRLWGLDCDTRVNPKTLSRLVVLPRARVAGGGVHAQRVRGGAEGEPRQAARDARPKTSSRGRRWGGREQRLHSAALWRGVA